MFRNLSITATLAVSAAALLGSPRTAHAHATSTGYENGGAPGSVIVWLGTYNHSTATHHLEGSMNLIGVNGNPFPSTTVAFTLGAGVGPAPFNNTAKPAGLIDGVTNFYGCDATAALTATCVGSAASFGQPDHWQGALFTGLSAGDYQFTWTPIANPTQEWSLLNANMNGIFTLGGSVINPVPEPTTLSLLGIGLLGGAFVGRRRRQSNGA